MTRLRSWIPLLLLGLLMPGPAGSVLGADDASRADEERFRAERATRLQAEDGWLAVTDLAWLKPGANRVGSDPDNEVVLRSGAPGLLGTLTLTPAAGGGAESATFQPAPGVAIEREGARFSGGPIQSDAEGKPADVLVTGDFRLILLRRNDRFALRIKDRQAPTRTEFAGLRWFPVADDWQVVARFTPHPTPRTIEFATIIGGVDVVPSPGRVTFERDGKSYHLDAADEGGGKLWFVFRDATAGTTTAGNARQLSAEAPVGDVVILNFNRAVNLPCAYIDHATCPIAPPQNRLPIAVEAGEQVYRPRDRKSESKAVSRSVP